MWQPYQVNTLWIYEGKTGKKHSMLMIPSHHPWKYLGEGRKKRRGMESPESTDILP